MSDEKAPSETALIGKPKFAAHKAPGKEIYFGGLNVTCSGPP